MDCRSIASSAIRITDSLLRVVAKLQGNDVVGVNILAECAITRGDGIRGRICAVQRYGACAGSRATKTVSAVAETCQRRLRPPLALPVAPKSLEPEIE